MLANPLQRHVDAVHQRGLSTRFLANALLTRGGEEGGFEREPWILSSRSAWSGPRGRTRQTQKTRSARPKPAGPKGCVGSTPTPGNHHTTPGTRPDLLKYGLIAPF